MEYKEVKEMLVEKYDRAIRAIAVANDCDMGVAFDKLCTNVLHDGNYPYIKPEAKEDFAKLLESAEESAK